MNRLRGVGGARRGRRPVRSGGEGGEERDANAWRSKLMVNEDRSTKSNLANIVTVLAYDPRWQGKLVLDLFAQRVMLTAASPAHEPYPDDVYPRFWKDLDDVRTATWLQQEEHIHVNATLVATAVPAVASMHPVHPVRRYLERVVHDGVPRVETWLIRYLGVADCPYVRAVGRMWLLSAVARIFQPGSKVDTMLILEGAQGIKKSSALRALASEEFFTDQMPELGSKDAMLQLQGKWIIEMAELDAMSRGEVSRVKAFLSHRKDCFRSPYGRNNDNFPRQCVFAGSVNHSAYLRDESGGRRFWPVLCTQIDLAALEQDRDQLWAEAVALYRAGVRWWIEDSELLEQAAKEQDDRYQADAWEAVIESYVSVQPHVTVGEVLEQGLQIEKGRWGQLEQTRVSKCLQRLGWVRRNARLGGTREWRYYPAPKVPVTTASPEESGTSPYPGNQAAGTMGTTGISSSLKERERVNQGGGDREEEVSAAGTTPVDPDVSAVTTRLPELDPPPGQPPRRPVDLQTEGEGALPPGWIEVIL